MNASLITASYSDNITVSFTSQAWFNATAVAKKFGKEPFGWLNQRDTVEYISSLADYFGNSNSCSVQEFNKISKLDGKSASSRAKLLKLVKQTGLVTTKQGSMENGGGTWFHPKLAVAFARWLDVKFAIWCDIQIEKILHPKPYGLKSHVLPYATKQQRQPLVKAVRQLVATAKEKGKELTYEEAHSMVNMTMGVKHIDELTAAQIPEALKVVGQMLQRVILEGEYIAKNEPLNKCLSEPPTYLDTETEKRLNNTIETISSGFIHKNAFKAAIQYRLQQVTGVDEFEKYQTKHLPIIDSELNQIIETTNATKKSLIEFETHTVKLICGKNLAELDAYQKNQLQKIVLRILNS